MSEIESWRAGHEQRAFEAGFAPSEFPRPYAVGNGVALWLAFAFVAAGEVQQLGLVIGQWHADVKALHHVRRIRTIGQRVPYAQRTTSQGFEFSAEFESCGLIDSAICQPTIADFGFLRDGESWGPASTELHQSREVRSTGFILGIIDCNAETAQSRTGEGIQRMLGEQRYRTRSRFRGVGVRGRIIRAQQCVDVGQIVTGMDVGQSDSGQFPGNRYGRKQHDFSLQV